MSSLTLPPIRPTFTRSNSTPSYLSAQTFNLPARHPSTPGPGPGPGLGPALHIESWARTCAVASDPQLSLAYVPQSTSTYVPPPPRAVPIPRAHVPAATTTATAVLPALASTSARSRTLLRRRLPWAPEDEREEELLSLPMPTAQSESEPEGSMSADTPRASSVVALDVNSVVALASPPPPPPSRLLRPDTPTPARTSTSVPGTAPTPAQPQAQTQPQANAPANPSRSPHRNAYTGPRLFSSSRLFRLRLKPRSSPFATSATRTAASTLGLAPSPAPAPARSSSLSLAGISPGRPLSPGLDVPRAPTTLSRSASQLVPNHDDDDTDAPLSLFEPLPTPPRLSYGPPRVPLPPLPRLVETLGAAVRRESEALIRARRARGQGTETQTETETATFRALSEFSFPASTSAVRGSESRSESEPSTWSSMASPVGATTGARVSPRADAPAHAHTYVQEGQEHDGYWVGVEWVGPVIVIPGDRAPRLPPLRPLPRLSRLILGVGPMWVGQTQEEADEEEAARRRVEGLDTPYRYPTSTAHLSHLSSPFLHPRPAPRPPLTHMRSALALASRSSQHLRDPAHEDTSTATPERRRPQTLYTGADALRPCPSQIGSGLGLGLGLGFGRGGLTLPTRSGSLNALGLYLDDATSVHSLRGRESGSPDSYTDVGVEVGIDARVLGRAPMLVVSPEAPSPTSTSTSTDTPLPTPEYERTRERDLWAVEMEMNDESSRRTAARLGISVSEVYLPYSPPSPSDGLCRGGIGFGARGDIGQTPRTPARPSHLAAGARVRGSDARAYTPSPGMSPFRAKSAAVADFLRGSISRATTMRRKSQSQSPGLGMGMGIGADANMPVGPPTTGTASETPQRGSTTREQGRARRHRRDSSSVWGESPVQICRAWVEPVRDREREREREGSSAGLGLRRKMSRVLGLEVKDGERDGGLGWAAMLRRRSD